MTVTVKKRKQNDPSLPRSLKLETSKSTNYRGKRTLVTETAKKDAAKLNYYRI